MANDWYVKINNVEHGPFAAERLKQLAQQGKVTPETFVKQGISGTWLRAKHVTRLFPMAASAGMPATAVPKDVPASISKPAEMSRAAFDGPVAPPPPPPVAESPWARDAHDGSAALQSPATKACPFCGETILSVAKKCKHCGEFLDHGSLAVPHIAASLSALQPPDAVPTLPAVRQHGRQVVEECLTSAQVPTSDTPATAPQDEYKCPACGFDGIKRLSLVYTEGTASISMTTMELGITSGTRISGTQQTTLARIASPPANPTSGVGCLCAISIIPLGFLGLGFYMLMDPWEPHGVAAILCVGSLAFLISCITWIVVKFRAMPVYRMDFDKWQRSFICLRCSRIFRAGTQTVHVRAAVVKTDWQTQEVAAHQCKLEKAQRLRIREERTKARAEALRRTWTTMNRALLKMAGGPDNMLLFRFLQVVTVAIAVGIVLMGLVVAAVMIVRMVKPT